MSSSIAAEIPDLERLMRDVLRQLFVARLGDDWASRASSAVSTSVSAAAQRARGQRPGEALRDDWDAVGIREMGKALLSWWDEVEEALGATWTSSTEMQVDLARLNEYRGRNLHRVGGRLGRISDEEAAAVILRLRIGFEEIRRAVSEESGEWWPYIEAVHSNIPELCWTRGTEPVEIPQLFVGDTVRLEVAGVNPTGNQHELRYRIALFAGPIIDSREWQDFTEFDFVLPSHRHAHFNVAAASAQDLENNDGVTLHIDLRPAP